MTSLRSGVFAEHGIYDMVWKLRWNNSTFTINQFKTKITKIQKIQKYKTQKKFKSQKLVFHKTQIGKLN